MFYTYNTLDTSRVQSCHSQSPGKSLHHPAPGSIATQEGVSKMFSPWCQTNTYPSTAGKPYQPQVYMSKLKSHHLPPSLSPSCLLCMWHVPSCQSPNLGLFLKSSFLPGPSPIPTATCLMVLLSFLYPTVLPWCWALHLVRVAP